MLDIKVHMKHEISLATFYEKFGDQKFSEIQ